MFPSFIFFLLSALFCLSFSSLPLLFDILYSKIVPTRWGLWQIYVVIVSVRIVSTRALQKVLRRALRNTEGFLEGVLRRGVSRRYLELPVGVLLDIGLNST